MSKSKALKIFAAAILLTACGGGGGGKPLVHLDMGIHDMAGNGQCSGNQKMCNGFCTDTSMDNANCGNCGVMCTNGQTCSNSQCGGGNCTGNQKMCNGTCTDTSSDNNNCGNCGVKCTNGQTCSNSMCGGGGGGDTCTMVFNCFIMMMCADQNCITMCESTAKMPSYGTDAEAVLNCVNTKLGNMSDPCAADTVCGANGSAMACQGCLYGTCTMGQSCVGGECSTQATPCFAKDN
jgi:hypothetical protein